MERVKTGISGLDELIEGGIPKGSAVLVSGGTGTCKTIFSMQFAYNGALLYNEP
ncbi:MAG: ATPase domain-containing protein, partial [Candidatus Diapherotrites archaeon]|nr:ATPase domain-containing protein [Candidatus Diapherotrites archaeon]